ncbi:MAG: ATP-binding protein [Deltaproteobacteria bacterium]|nr:ATP-binding protein [Deltaproteobacteria bacterium]
MPEITSLARMENLQRLTQFVAKQAQFAHLPARRVRKIELAVEEVLVNIFSYAYPDAEGPVSIACQTANDRLIIEIRDIGVPFNILEVPNPDVGAQLSERQIGGLGAFFVRKIADEVHYRREEDQNVLVLIFDHHSQDTSTFQIGA